VGSIGSVQAESRHSLVFMGQIDLTCQSSYNYKHG
jgi:hypothetical protein